MSKPNNPNRWLPRQIMPLNESLVLPEITSDTDPSCWYLLLNRCDARHRTWNTDHNEWHRSLISWQDLTETGYHKCEHCQRQSFQLTSLDRWQPRPSSLEVGGTSQGNWDNWKYEWWRIAYLRQDEPVGGVLPLGSRVEVPLSKAWGSRVLLLIHRAFSFCLLGSHICQLHYKLMRKNNKSFHFQSLHWMIL